MVSGQLEIHPLEENSSFFLEGFLQPKIVLEKLARSKVENLHYKAF
jgi:hypothetical protein